MEEVIFTGFLTKSPPERKINRARWQRRWFVLKRSPPNAVYLQYYKDQNSAKPKGTIDLNSCEQVDQGLTFESRRSLAKNFIFDIVTPKRKYFLVTNTEIEMIRWVREICVACGFQLEGQEEGTPYQPSQPINVTQNSTNRYPTGVPASAPINPAEAGESYIPLDECSTGEGKLHSQSVPANGGWDSASKSQELFQIDFAVCRPDSSGSNCSSIPSEMAPLPPTQMDSAASENYDVPPVLRGNASSSSVQPTYDIPPALLRRESSFNHQDDIFKPVPGQRSTDLNRSISPDEAYRLNENPQDLYDTPPPLDSGGLYDIPPAALNLIRNQDKGMSQSTDRLAQDFQKISIRNSVGASDVAPDLYNVLPTPSPSVRNATDLYNSPVNGSAQKAAAAPPRPPKRQSVVESQPVATPPRPHKPNHLKTMPVTPPPSFDDSMYSQLPAHPAKALSPVDLETRLHHVAPVYDTPPGCTPPAASTNWNDVKTPTSGHQWLDSKIPIGYINTKQSGAKQSVPKPSTSVPPKSANYHNIRGATMPQRANTIEYDSRDSPTQMILQQQQQQQQQQTSYMPMTGSNSPSNVFQYPDSSLYMPMESANEGLRPEGRLPSDAQNEPYAIMSSAVGELKDFPLQKRALPVDFHRQTFSGGRPPPPIDRSLKPDRKLSEGAVHNIGMAGSFYATSTTDDPGLIPVQSSRTKSFSRKAGQYENHRLDPDSDPFRGRTNTGESATSSSDDDMYGAEGDFYQSARPVPIPDEDTYIYKDVPAMGAILERPISEGISSSPIPASLPSQQSDDIEYLELSHENEEPRQPPPRPPKPSSPKVDYIDLDHQRMMALKKVTEKREEELQDTSITGRGTLTKREL